MRFKFLTMPNNTLKAILLLFTMIFMSELLIMSFISTVIADKFPPWGFAALDGVVISMVSLIAIYLVHLKSWINFSKDGNSEIIILKVGSIIFSIEVVIMFLFSIETAGLSKLDEIIIDSSVLSVLAVSLMYFTILRPAVLRENRDAKEILNENFVTNVVVLSSFAILLLLVFYIVYTQNTERGETLIIALALLYGLFLLMSGIVLFVITSSMRKRIKNEKTIGKLAYYDNLTNLGNNRLFEFELDKAMKSSTSDTKQVAIMFLDLDKFKNINDTYGHDVGDMTIKEAACRIAKCVRNGDVPCRIGGDEFAIILPTIDSIRAAEDIAKRILTAFEYAFNFGDVHFNMGISIGVSVLQEEDTQTALVKRADESMYKSKKTGGSSYTLSSDIK